MIVPALIMALSLPACEAPPPFVLDDSGIQAIYAGGTLWTDLPPTHTQDQLIAAAEAALRSRGYVIASRRGVHEEPARIMGHMGGTHPIQESAIFVQAGTSMTRIQVRVEPWGNDAESRLLLRAMLAILGYDEGTRRASPKPPEAPLRGVTASGADRQ